jgi:lipopolysaccharide/colanic/teichoic acid biosynthesis glycosyltransferase
MPSLYEFFTGKIPTHHISDGWILLQSLNRAKLYYRHFKRITDVLLAAVGLALTWPRWTFIATAIKLDSPGPVFFRQERLGRDSKPFNIIKSRTMIQAAERDGPQFAYRGDPGITRVGRILRRAPLDELPQFYNILKVEMSFIGPRPELEIFVREFQQSVRWGQVRARRFIGLTVR